MNHLDFKKLSQIKASIPMINITEVRNQSDRVLLIGENKEGIRYCLSITQGNLDLKLYNKTEVVKELFGQSLPVMEVLPDLIFPDFSDFEFCRVLKEKGLTLNFDQFMNLSQKIAI